MCLRMMYLDFFEAINSGVQVKVDLGAIADFDAITDTSETLGFQLLQFLEERGSVLFALASA